MVEPADVMKVYLRRYHGSDESNPCPGKYGYHNAKSFLCEHPQSIDYEEGVWVHSGVDEPPRDDPRWPVVCDYCNYRFVGDDVWQVFDSYQYVRSDTGEVWSTHDLLPGAMFDSFWHRYFGGIKENPDGLVLAVALPPGGGQDVWCIDGPASSGGYWTRQGVPPNITVTPSILTGRYHGFLTNGVLTDSLGDRPLSPGPDQ